MQTFLQNFMRNKHTSGAGLVYIVCMALSKIGAIWFPEYSVQLAQTLDVVKEAAIGYGFIMAGDGGKKDDGSLPPSPPTDATVKTIALIVGIAGISAALVGCLKR